MHNSFFACPKFLFSANYNSMSLTRSHHHGVMGSYGVIWGSSAGPQGSLGLNRSCHLR